MRGARSGSGAGNGGTGGRILADVDTGIDDACALIHLAGSPVTLAAVTTTGGNASARDCALNTLAVLDAAGLGEVEVGVGAATPLRRPPQTTPETHGAHGLGYARTPALTDRLSPRPAMEIWLEELYAHPGETTILCTAPLTNLALALRAEPRLPQLARRVVIMGGAYHYPGNTTPTAEWNTWVDPDAAKEVFDAFEGWPEDCLPIVCALETTERIVLTPPRLDDLLLAAGCTPVRWSASDERHVGPRAATGSDLCDLLADALRFYFEFHDDHGQGYLAHLHDLFAAQVATGAAEFETITTTVDVETRSSLLLGTTVRDDRGFWGRRPNARVVVAHRPEAVLATFDQTVAAAAAGRYVGSSRLSLAMTMSVIGTNTISTAHL